MIMMQRVEAMIIIVIGWRTEEVGHNAHLRHSHMTLVYNNYLTLNSYNSYSFTSPSLCMQYRNTHPLDFVLGICASILHTNFGKWSITITKVDFLDKS